MTAQEKIIFSGIPGGPKGCGVGLRTRHYEEILRDWPAMDWFEAISENYMDSGGRPVRTLEAVRAHYPVALHGVSLSIGSADPLNENYLERLRILADRIEPFIVSDHLCWTGVEGQQLHDLLPLPFTEEAICHLVPRVQEVQEKLRRPILLENVSSYVTYRHSVIPEWEFLSEVARRSGCGILLDLNNIYVNARNHGFSPESYLRGVESARVAQFHLAGHSDRGDFLFDTHGGQVVDPVWKIYEQALALFGPVSTLIEWDDAIPEFARLSEEAAKARAFYRLAEVRGRTGVSEVSERYLSKVPSPKGGEISLLELQKRMRDFFDPETSAPPQGAAEFLNPQGKAAGHERMSVYAEGYPVRIHEALKECYEAVFKVTGPETFWKLASAYAQKYPSSDYNLNRAGQQFPEFLEKSGLASQWPFLLDLARLDRAVREAFHAFDEPPQDLSKLQSLPVEDWEKARFVFQPSLRILKSEWPVVEIWNQRRDARAVLLDPAERKPRSILVSRHDLRVRVETVQDSESLFLELLREGHTLGEVCGRMAEAQEELPLMAWFSKWAACGMVARIELAAREKS